MIGKIGRAIPTKPININIVPTTLFRAIKPYLLSLLRKRETIEVRKYHHNKAAAIKPVKPARTE